MSSDAFFQVPTNNKTLIDPRVHIFRRLAPMPGEIELLQVDCYGIVTERFIALCDTSLNPQDSTAMLQMLQNTTNDRAIFVINSHADWDHVWGNSTFASTPSIPIIAHDNALARWQSAIMHDALTDFQQRFPIFRDVTLTPPTLTFNDRLTLHGGDLTLEIFYAPGHQPDHIAIWISQLRLLLAFDAVEYPFLTLESATSVSAMIATLEHFIRLAPTSILCSHGEKTDATLIQDNLNYIRLIEQKCRAFLATHPFPGASELEHTSRLIDYPWQAAIPAGGAVNDEDFYSEVHEQNARAIMQWVMSA